MKKQCRVFLLFILLASLLCPMLTMADSGPKPSVRLSFQGLEDGVTCYATLLSREDINGPWSKQENFDESFVSSYADKSVWEAFNNYKDSDGFYFLGCFDECGESKTFQWNYYPPTEFKVLLYFPESGTFAISLDSVEKKSFHSYYDVNAENAQNTGVIENVYRTHSFLVEIGSFAARVAITFAVELLIALPFGYRSRNQIKIIAIVNLVTQILLNLLLNVFLYRYGWFSYVLNYLWMEFVVFLLEGLIYAKTLEKFRAHPERPPRSPRLPWLYALTANIASFAAGLGLAHWLSGIF